MNTEDVISEYSVRTYLKDCSSLFELEVFDTIDSTNTYLKNTVTDDTKAWHTVIASAQSAGRGRKGRSFISPAGTGVYLSVLLRPASSAYIATRITTAAAVAACLAIEKCTGSKPVIKWVNDVFLNGRKVCGILTEASLNPKTHDPDWVIMGIGFNIYEPDGGFDKEIENIAGAIAKERSHDLKSRIVAAFLIELHRLAGDLENADYAGEYKKRSFLIGRNVNVLSGDFSHPATVLDIDENCHLLVRYEDGSVEALSSGEVSIRER